MTVGKAVSTEDEFEVLAGLEDDDDSSMESEAMAPGVGANVAGMFVGGCCFFFIKSLQQTEQRPSVPLFEKNPQPLRHNEGCCSI